MKNSKRLVIALAPNLVDDFIGPEQMSRLERAYGQCVRLVPNGPATADDWRDQLLKLQPQALLTGWGTPALPASVVPPLQIVGHTAGSVRDLVNRSMIESGLTVVNWGDAAAPTVAECALLLTLACLRRFTEFTALMHVDRGWKSPASNECVSLYGRRVGIHGFGRIARQLVKLLAPFGCEISAYSAGVPSSEYAADGVREAKSLEELFSTVEVLVEVEALNDVTRGSVTESLLRRLPTGGVFVNVGRGATVDEGALERVAAEGRLQIGLDVYAREPLRSDSPLRGMKNVILLPHVAGPTRDQRRACGARAVEALYRFATDGTVERAISVAEYDRST